MQYNERQHQCEQTRVEEAIMTALIDPAVLVVLSKDGSLGSLRWAGFDGNLHGGHNENTQGWFILAKLARVGTGDQPGNSVPG